MKNVKIFEVPEEVNIIDWSIEHVGCDALIVKDDINKDTMNIKAYALNEQGNKELDKLPFAYNDDIGYFRGLDKSMINHLDCII